MPQEEQSDSPIINQPSSVIRRERRPRGKPFEKGNRYAWKSGQSGNPAGRPKFRTLTEGYRRVLSQTNPDDPLGRTNAELIAESLVNIAIGRGRGNSTQAARELANRTEGTARPGIEFDSKQSAEQILAALLGVSVEELPGPEEFESPGLLPWM